ncbi:hypothetical protein EJB05_21185, partial [Eragrostis curvula]
MAMSQTGWIAIGLGARLVMFAALAMSVQLKYRNRTKYDYGPFDNFNQLQSYTYAVAAAAIGMAGSVLQTPVSVYLLCKRKLVTSASVLLLDISMYTDILLFIMAACMRAQVVTVVLASGVGAGFGATDDVLQYVNHWRKTWSWYDNDTSRDLVDYYHKGAIAIVFLLVGMVLSLAATVVSTRLRTRASNDSDDF